MAVSSGRVSASDDMPPRRYNFRPQAEYCLRYDLPQGDHTALKCMWLVAAGKTTEQVVAVKQSKNLPSDKNLFWVYVSLSRDVASPSAFAIWNATPKVIAKRVNQEVVQVPKKNENNPLFKTIQEIGLQKNPVEVESTIGPVHISGSLATNNRMVSLEGLNFQIKRGSQLEAEYMFFYTKSGITSSQDLHAFLESPDDPNRKIMAIQSTTLNRAWAYIGCFIDPVTTLDNTILNLTQQFMFQNQVPSFFPAHSPGAANVVPNNDFTDLEALAVLIGELNGDFTFSSNLSLARGDNGEVIIDGQSFPFPNQKITFPVVDVFT